jgi:hypothetical protein
MGLQFGYIFQRQIPKSPRYYHILKKVHYKGNKDTPYQSIALCDPGIICYFPKPVDFVDQATFLASSCPNCKALFVPGQLDPTIETRESEMDPYKLATAYGIGVYNGEIDSDKSGSWRAGAQVPYQAHLLLVEKLGRVQTGSMTFRVYRDDLDQLSLEIKGPLARGLKVTIDDKANLE